jgi:hypothetical protein
VVGDLVLRLKQDGHGKLESPWLGPKKLFIFPIFPLGGSAPRWVKSIYKNFEFTITNILSW